MNATAHFENSTLREHIVEHLFVGDVLRALWCRGVTDIEVLRSEFDSHGYDLVMGSGGIVRHIQFKTGTSPKPSEVPFHGCSQANRVVVCFGLQLQLRSKWDHSSGLVVPLGSRFRGWMPTRTPRARRA
jgi:hypothetical protein